MTVTFLLSLPQTAANTQLFSYKLKKKKSEKSINKLHLFQILTFIYLNSISVFQQTVFPLPNPSPPIQFKT